MSINPSRHFASALLAASTVMALSAPAAAAVRYDFAGSFQADTDGDTINEIYEWAFNFTTASFITSLTEVTPAACSITGTFYNCGATQTLDPGSTSFGAPLDDDFLGFNYANADGNGGGTNFYFFPGGAFGAFGSYSTSGQPDPSGPLTDPNGDTYSVGNAGPAILTVSGAGAVPEPATWATMMLGFGLVGAAMRRRGTLVARA